MDQVGKDYPELRYFIQKFRQFMRYSNKTMDQILKYLSYLSRCSDHSNHTRGNGERFDHDLINLTFPLVDISAATVRM